MNSDLTRKIVDQCPNFYPDSFYFECGDGWFELIEQFSLKVESIIAALDPSERGAYSARQIKSKFGGLRIYLSDSTEEMQLLIDEAEAASYKICESCGRPAIVRKDLGWVFTLCDDHYKEKKKLRNENY